MISKPYPRIFWISLNIIPNFRVFLVLLWSLCNSLNSYRVDQRPCVLVGTGELRRNSLRVYDQDLPDPPPL